MPTLAPPIAAALALAITAHGAPRADTIEPALPLVLDVRKDAWDRLTLPVSIGEKGPFHFLIDTAAERTVVSDAVATRLGLAPRERGIVLGIAGTKEVATVDVDDIRYGNVSYDGGGAPVLGAGDLGADGIVGLDGLADHRVLFDFAHDRVALIDPRSREARDDFDIIVTARRRGDQLILANATIDGVHADIVIDTGAEFSIGNRALQRALAHRARAEGTTLHSVTGQEIPAEYAVVRELAIDRITISNPFITYADAPTFAALRLDRRPALLLGMKDLRLFRRFAIDFAKRKILFDLPS
ncbi:MAG: aspartyl protease family protein [Sphingomonadales bacterium]|nr:aspartyl protease family protein [Sphingomonadales bacterium]